jgi:oxygen-independent coproporphyrinogen-3 oxidase
MGVSSISSIGNVYSQNSVTTMEYESSIEDNRLPVRKGVAVDADDLLRADVIQSLMCYDELVFDDFDAKHDIDFRSYFAAEIDRFDPLIDDDLVELSRRGIRILPKGRLLLRNIAMIFDRYINDAGNDKRFSRAI